MSQYTPFRLEPDWPRLRELVAKRLKVSEDEVQRMLDNGDSLERVELVMTIEEVQERLQR
jgi:hypothetical protein